MVFESKDSSFFLFLFSNMAAVMATDFGSLMSELRSESCTLIVSRVNDMINLDTQMPVMLVDDLKNLDSSSVCDLVVLDKREGGMLEANTLNTHTKTIVISDSEMDFELTKKLSNVVFLEKSTSSSVVLMWSRRHVLAPFQLTVADSESMKRTLDNDLTRKWVFDNQTIVASAFGFEPYTTYNSNNEADGGYEFRIAQTLARSLRLQLEVRPPLDGHRWGSETPLGSGNYTGLVGELASGIADVGWANLFVTKGRSEVIDFSEWYTIKGSCAAVPRPQAYPPFMALVLPYTLLNWILLGISALSIGALLIVFSLGRSTFRAAGANAITVVAAIMFAQSHPPVTAFSHNGIRIAILLFLLSMFVVTRDYGGSLTSVMAVTPAPPPLDSFAAMANSHRSSDLEKIFFCCTWLRAQAQASTDSDLNYLATSATEHNRVLIMNLLRRVGRYEEEKVAVFHAEHTLDFQIRKHLRGIEARVHLTSQCFGKNRIALGLSKGSIIKRAMDANIVRLREAGVFDRIFYEVLEDVGSIDKEGEDYAPLNLSEVQGPFFITGIALTTATLSLAIEIIVAMKRE